MWRYNCTFHRHGRDFIHLQKAIVASFEGQAYCKGMGTEHVQRVKIDPRGPCVQALGEWQLQHSRVARLLPVAVLGASPTDELNSEAHMMAKQSKN